MSQLADRGRTTAEPLDYQPANRIAQRVEDAIDGRRMLKSGLY